MLIKESVMTAAASPTEQLTSEHKAPRFGGLLWKAARITSPLTIGLAGKRWNPIFSVVEHVGRKSGRSYSTPIAARRTRDGFVLTLAFGAQVDWYRNLIAAGRGTIRWRDRAYAVGAPIQIDPSAGRAAFHPIQRFLLWAGGVDGYIHVPDADDGKP
jgi:deazaflavin-dependent oxidoreductase (nitroreductase family)